MFLRNRGALRGPIERNRGMGKNPIIISLLIMLGMGGALEAMSCCSFNQSPATTINTLNSAMEFTPNGCLVVGADDLTGTVNTYSPISGCVYNTTPSSTFNTGAPVRDVDTTPVGCLSIATDNELIIYQPDGSCDSCAFSQSSSTPVVATSTAFAFSECVVVGDNLGNVNIYGPISLGSCTYDLTTPVTPTFNVGAAVTAIAFSPTNNCLVVGDIAGNVNIYRQISGCLYDTTFIQLISLPAAIQDISFSASGCLAISQGIGGNEVTIYQPGLNCIHTLTTTITGVPSPAVIDFSPTEDCLVVGDNAGGITFYNRTGPASQCMYSLTGVPFVTLAGPVNSIVFSPNGCLAAATASQITIYAPNTALDVTLAPLVTTICSGGTITLTATGTGGTGPVNYVYTFRGPDGSVVQTGPSNILTITPATEADAGEYTVTLTDGSGCQATAIAFAAVTAIRAVLSVLPDTICDGGTATLTTLINGGIPPYTATFSDGNVITGITGNTVTYPVSPAMTTAYTVTITDSSMPTPCSATSNMVTVTVDSIITPVILTAETNCSGQITITGTGTPGNLIQVFNGPDQIAVPVFVANDGTFSITTISLSAGTYSSLTLTATNLTLCTATIPVPPVTVNPSLGVIISGDQLVCARSTLTLQAIPNGGLLPYVDYSWTGPNGFMQTGPSDTISILHASLANEGIYTVTVTDSFGCTASASIFVQVVSVGVALAVQPSFLCGGVGQSTLTGTIALGTPPYTADIFADNVLINTITNILGNSFTDTVMPTVTTVYTTVITDANGCSATSNPVTVTVSQVNVLSITSTTANCNGTVTIVGMSDPGNTIGIFNGLTQVGGPSIVPPSGNFSITTSAVPVSGMYTFDVVATNPFGCQATASAGPVQVNTRIIVTVTPTSQTVCPGSTATLMASATGGTGNYTFTWTGPDGFTAMGPTVMVTPVSPINTGTYFVTVTDDRMPTNCQGFASASILVTDVVLSAIGTVCSGTSPVLTITIADTNPPYTATININGSPYITIFDINTNVFTYTPPPINVATTYTVTITNSAVPPCTVLSNPVTITASTVNPPVITSTVVNCDGTVTIMGTAEVGTTITILRDGINVGVPVVVGPSGAFTITTETLVPGMNIVLTVTATNSFCCPGSAAVVVNVNEPWLLTLEAPSICSGSTLNITSTVMGGVAPYTYAWTGPAGFVSTSPNVAIPNATLANAGLYTLTVTDEVGCTVTDSIFAQVTNVAVTLSADPTFVCAGDPSTLTATVVGGLAPYVIQFSGFPPRAPSNALVYTQEVFPTIGNNNFTVTVTDANGCISTSDSVVFELAPLTPPIIVSTTVDCLGEAVITGTATPGATITVSSNGVNVSVPVIVDAQGNFTVTTIPLTPGLNTLTVTATNGLGCSASLEEPVIVTVPNQLALTLVAPAICSGGTLAITSTVMGGVAPYTYAWTGPAGFVSTSPNVSIPNATLVNAGLYTLTVTDEVGCTVTESIFAQVTNVAVTLSADPTFVCAGDPSTLTATVVGGLAPYVIQFSGFPPRAPSNALVYTQEVFPTIGNNNFTVTVTDENGCTATSDAVVFDLAPVSAPVITSTVVNCDGTVTIMGTATPGNTITVLRDGISVSASIIVGESGTFTITTGVLVPGMNISLTVTETNSFCCLESATTVVTVNEPLLLTLVAPSICSGATLSITSTVMGGLAPYTYAWTGPAGFVSTSPNVSIPNATLVNAGLYTLTVTDEVGCTVTESIFAQVTNVAVTLSADPTFVCAGDPSTLTATVVGGLAPYVIQFSGFPPRAPSNALVYTQEVFPTIGNNNFTVTVTDANGCTATSDAVVFELAPLTPPVITSVTVNCIGQITITGTASPGNTITVLIDGMNVAIPVIVDNLGNFTVTTESLAPGTYTVTVTATNEFGCSSSTVLLESESAGPLVDVIVPDPLMVTLSGPSVVCDGDTLNITSTVTGATGNYMYEWTGPNGFTASTPNISIPNVTLANAGQYTLVVTSGDCVAEASIFVQVTSIGITLSADPFPICLGESSLLTATIASGLPPYTVTFTGFSPIITSDTVVTQMVTPVGDAVYTATVVDSNGCTATSNPVSFTFVPLSVPVINTVINNSSGQVTITGTATPGTLINVLLNGIPIAIPVFVQPDGTFIITTMCLGRGDYTFEIQATNSACCTASAFVTTFVDCAPTIIRLTNPPCSGSCSPTPIITGTTSPNTGIIIFANGVEIGRTASNAIGEFTFVPAQPLANGTYTFIATTIPGACDCPEGDSNAITIVIDARMRNCLSLAIRNKFCAPCLTI